MPRRKMTRDPRFWGAIAAAILTAVLGFNPFESGGVLIDPYNPPRISAENVA